MQKNISLPELTFRGLLLGSILTLVFTASNVYLGLKVGLTFSSSIPAVVISMAVLSLFKNSNILENNMIQTQASAAGTLSAVIFVIPGLLMSGYWSEFALWQTFMICLCGGGLGVLFTIPLRRAMVVESKLAYPEGRAAAEILKVKSEKQSKSGIFELVSGSVIATFVSLLANGFKLLASSSNIAFVWNKMAFAFSTGYSLALLGAGYLVGLAGAIALFVGMFLAWGIFTPYLSSFEFDGLKNANELAVIVWQSKVRLIGAGAIAIAALWTLFELIKPVLNGIKEIFSNTKPTQSDDLKDKDLSFKSMFILFVILVAGLLVSFFSFVSNSGLSPFYEVVYALVGTFIAVFIGFFVAAACGYMAGLVGSSSSPISGIGLLGIIVSSLVILFIGTQENLFLNQELSKFAIALAIFTTSVIIATAAISNDNLQDLKTGQLVGATPWKQQVALLIGCIFGALVIAPVLNLLYQAYGFKGALPREGMDANAALSAPQASLMNTIAQGIFNHNIDWNYITFGVFVGIIIIFIDRILKLKGKMSLPPLAVGIGIYLPADIIIPLIIGGILKYFVFKILTKKYSKAPDKKERLSTHEQRGTLFASGLIVGESILGVIIAGFTAFSVSKGGSENPLALNFGNFHDSQALAAIFFIAVIFYFIKRILRTA